MNIAIIGSGITGLSTAVRILENYPFKVNVTIFSRELPPNTTGDVAAGFLYPYAVDKEDKRIMVWFKKTFDYLADKIATDEFHYQKGLYYQDVYQLSKTEIKTDKPLYKVFPYVRNLNSKELERFGNVKFGVAFKTIFAQGSNIIQYFKNRFESLGGVTYKLQIDDIDHVQALNNFDVVINCTGNGAITLCNDLQSYPIRGQIIKIYAPWLKYGVDCESSYIFPQSDGNVILGGTTQIGDWNTEVNKTDRENIWKKCVKLIPGIKSCSIVSEHVGLRPGRKHVRLEREERINKRTGKKYLLIHNYGHGGAGLTLFWGCAEDVLHIMTQDGLFAKL